MKNVREFKRGETIYVAVAKDHGVEYEKRIFIAYIHGAWRPYVCVHEDDENDFIAGCPMFKTENWPDDVKALDEHTPMSKEQKEIERLRKRVEELERIIEMGAEIDWAMNNIGKNNFEFTGIQAGTKVLVRDADEGWQERIFLTSIQGAWYPYICVDMSFEDEYLRGEAFEIGTWHDLKEIEGEKTIVLPQSHFSGHSNEV